MSTTHVHWSLDSVIVLPVEVRDTEEAKWEVVLGDTVRPLESFSDCPVKVNFPFVGFGGASPWQTRSTSVVPYTIRRGTTRQSFNRAVETGDHIYLFGLWTFCMKGFSSSKGNVTYIRLYIRIRVWRTPIVKSHHVLHNALQSMSFPENTDYSDSWWQDLVVLGGEGRTELSVHSGRRYLWRSTMVHTEDRPTTFSMNWLVSGSKVGSYYLRVRMGVGYRKETLRFPATHTPWIVTRPSVIHE